MLITKIPLNCSVRIRKLSPCIQVPERSINSSSRRSKYLLHDFRLTLWNASICTARLVPVS